MGIIKYTTSERDLLARLMRAEALGEGNLGMLMVGNVGVNRVLADCLTFSQINTIQKMVYQTPGGFSSLKSNLFYGSPTSSEKALADRILKGEYYHPATNALWFYAPGSGKNCNSNFYGQAFSGKYKNHCFYKPTQGECPTIY